MRVLVVEDSAPIRRAVAGSLEESGYAVDSTAEGDEGLWMAETYEYDVAVLDIMLPGLDGLSLLRRLRESGQDTPVLFLTARDQIEDRVNGLNAGADDYLVKPFAIEEMLARVNALCRRRYGDSDPILQCADLEIDTVSKSVKRRGIPIEIPARYYAVLEYLIRNRGKVVSRTEIETHVYDEMVSPMSNVVDVAIHALRNLLRIDSTAKPLIHTKRGLGYVLEERD
ncbi:MAG: response regulator transcription factor [Verrucomicrobiota bacterium]